MKLLKFSAEWCGPCGMLKKVIDGIEDLPIEIQEINIDEETELAAQYNIRNIPTCVIVSDSGEEIRRKSGMMNKEQFLLFVEE